jgi:hypothetical protein
MPPGPAPNLHVPVPTLSRPLQLVVLWLLTFELINKPKPAIRAAAGRLSREVIRWL